LFTCSIGEALGDPPSFLARATHSLFVYRETVLVGGASQGILGEQVNAVIQEMKDSDMVQPGRDQMKNGRSVWSADVGRHSCGKYLGQICPTLLSYGTNKILVGVRDRRDLPTKQIAEPIHGYQRCVWQFVNNASLNITRPN
jgi:hypothetical protein